MKNQEENKKEEEKAVTFDKESLELLLDTTRCGERDKIRSALVALASVEHSNCVGYYCRRAMLAISREDFYEMNSGEIIAFIFSK